MNVIAVMGNTSNAGLSIRQQKLSLLSLRGKKGGDSRNHRPLFNEDKKMLKPGLMMAQIGQKSSLLLTKHFCAQKAAQVAFTRTFYSHKSIHPHFLLPQVKSRTFLGSKIVSFRCAKKAAMEYPPPLVEKNMKKPVTTCHLGIPRLQAHS